MTEPTPQKGLAGHRLTADLTRRLIEPLEWLAEARAREDGQTDAFTLQALNPIRAVVALSGGKDSMALLDIASRLWKDPHQHLIGRLAAVHVHHGLQKEADLWATHCQKECDARGVEFALLTVKVDEKGRGVEAAAREARYRALTRWAADHDYDAVITAHHEDDRLETFLLQWIRGAGPEGLAAFPTVRTLKDVEGGLPGRKPEAASRIALVRPWGDVSRADLHRYVRQRRLKSVEDPSNADTRFARNYVRHKILPALETLRPGFKKAASRSIELTAQAVEVLQSVAKEDVARCQIADDPSSLSISRLLSLVPARQSWALRTWIQTLGFTVPNRARLDDTLRQLRESGHDAQVAMQLGTGLMRRWGDRLSLRAEDLSPVPVGATPLVWSGDLTVTLPDGQNLRAERLPEGEPGLTHEDLMRGQWTLRPRQGGERLRLFPHRPSKALKDLFAQAGVPPFDRTTLPLVWHNDELIYVAGLGMDVRRLTDAKAGEARYRLYYEAPAQLWSDVKDDDWQVRMANAPRQ